MAIALRVAGSWAEYTADGSCTIPSTPQSGDRMFLLVGWKDYSITLTTPSGWTAIGSAFADGTTGSGNGTGSVKVQAFYRDWQSGDSNPSLDFSSSPNEGGAVILVFSKAGTDTWQTPSIVNAALSWGTSSTTTSASSTVDVPDGSVVIGMVAFRDDSATMTRGTAGIDVASGITWNGNYVESPATHGSYTAGADGSYDAGYRLVTTGATGATLRQTGTLSASETGSALWIVQRAASVTNYPRTTADSLSSLSEAMGRVATFVRAVADTPATLSEAVGRVLSAVRTAGDSIASLSESAGKRLARAVADTIAGGGSSTVAQDNFNGTGLQDLSEHVPDVGDGWSVGWETNSPWSMRLSDGYAQAETYGDFNNGEYLSGIFVSSAGTMTDGDVYLRLDGGGGYEGGPVARWLTGQHCYLAVAFGGVGTTLYRLTSGLLYSVASNGTQAGPYLRLYVSGSSPTTLKVRSWVTTEPGTWLIDTTDNTASNQTALAKPVGIFASHQYDGYDYYMQTVVDDYLATASGGGAGMSEALTRVWSRGRALSESVASLSESLARAFTGYRVAGDSLASVSDAVARVRALVRAVADSPATISESVARVRALVRASADSVSSLGEALVKVLSRALADALSTLSEAVDAIKTGGTTLYEKAVGDSVATLSEGLTSLGTYFRAAADSLSAVSEALAALKAKFIGVADSVATVSESVARGAATRVRAAADSVSSVAESLVKSAATRVRAVADSVSGLSEAVVRLRALVRAAADSLSAVSEAVGRVRALVRTAADSLATLSEAVAALKAKFVSVGDSVSSLSEALGRVYAVGRSTADSLGSLSEALASGRWYGRALADEVATLTESLVRWAMGYLRSIGESITVSESVGRTFSIGRIAGDAVSTLTESLYRWKGKWRTPSDSVGSLSESLVRGSVLYHRYVGDSFAFIRQSVGEVVARLGRRIVITLRDGLSLALARAGLARIGLVDRSVTVGLAKAGTCEIIVLPCSGGSQSLGSGDHRTVFRGIGDSVPWIDEGT